MKINFPIPPSFVIMNLKSFFTKKRVIYGVIALVILGGLFYFFFLKKNTKQETLTVHSGDFLQQVSVSGNVVANQNIDLSFPQSGIVKKVYVNVGDKVKAYNILASQDTAQLYAQLSEMQAGINLQKAKLAQLLAGASPEDIKISQDAISAAQQNLGNSYQTALINMGNAYTSVYNAYTSVVFIQNTYFFSIDQQEIKVQDNRVNISNKMADVKNYLDISKNSSDSGVIDSSILNVISDLSSVYDSLNTIRSQCDEGVYYSKISSADKTSLDTQKTNINTALTNITSSEQSILNYKLSLRQAQSQLDLKKATPRQTDIDVYQAQIDQAQASAKSVEEQIRKEQIFAPIDGVITQMNAKVGSIFSSGQIAASLISTGKFEIESYVPEIYISLVKIGNDSNITLDSYGPDKIFKAKVISINPSETVKDGVSTYKIKLELQDDNGQIRDGMTANVVITTEKKSNTISVPQGIIINKDGKKFVKVKESDSVGEREVSTGDLSSSGQVEILSGIKDGDVVIVK